ncbi:protein of unknown function [Trichlorobacter ammonificans]|uniref:WCX domain-containing protein n=1 Tax=Trichlorobacter ammonificans TaxID=2916410 RepID=A0ABM9DAF1_9BACT|nr:protein of unknown function [Trichlorobacter ammonificans]
MMEILKHGSHVEVLEPEWLREKVTQVFIRRHACKVQEGQQK